MEVEFLIFQKLDNGTLYYTEKENDLSGKYVPLSEYKKLQEKCYELQDRIDTFSTNVRQTLKENYLLLDEEEYYTHNE